MHLKHSAVVLTVDQRSSRRAEWRREEGWVIPKAGSRASSLVLCLIGLITLAACGAPALSRPHRSSHLTADREPTAAATFISAYAHGDLAASDRAASPLYQAEWARRGLSLQDRYDLLPDYFKAPTHPAEWLHFSYVGGLVGDGGFATLLYTAYSTGGNGDPAPTVWRVDTDPHGKVIWGELVYLFSPEASTVATVDGAGQRSATPLPSTLKAYGQQPLMGIQSTHGREGYYAVDAQPTTSSTGSATVSSSVLFFAIDSDGNVRPGTWSFGEPQPGQVDRSGASEQLPPDQARLLRAYLATLP